MPARQFKVAWHTFVAMLLIVATGMTASCSLSDSEKYDYLRLQVDGQPTLTISKKNTWVRGIVVFFHGLDQDEFAVTSNDARRGMTGTLVEAGFAVVSSSARGNAFNDPTTMQSYREIGSLAMQHFHIANVFFLAESFGAIPAMGLLASGYSPVRGLAAISPVLNFDSATDQWPAGFNGDLPDAVDPLHFPTNAFGGKKLRFYVSPNDSVVSAKANSMAFKERFSPFADISVVSCSGEHGDASCVQGGDIAKWFTSLDKQN